MEEEVENKSGTTQEDFQQSSEDLPMNSPELFCTQDYPPKKAGINAEDEPPLKSADGSNNLSKSPKGIRVPENNIIPPVLSLSRDEGNSNTSAPNQSSQLQNVGRINVIKSANQMIVNNSLIMEVTECPFELSNFRRLESLACNAVIQFGVGDSIRMEPVQLKMEEHALNTMLKIALDLNIREMYRNFLYSKQLSVQELMDGIVERIGHDVDLGEDVLKRALDSLGDIRAELAANSISCETQTENLPICSTCDVNINMNESDWQEQCTSKSISSRMGLKQKKKLRNEVVPLDVENVRSDKPEGFRKSGRKLKASQKLNGYEKKLHSKLLQTYCDNLNPDSTKKPQPIPPLDLMSYSGILYEAAKGDLKEEFGSAREMIAFFIFIGKIVNKFSSSKANDQIWNGSIWRILKPNNDSKRAQTIVNKKFEALINDPDLSPEPLLKSEFKNKIVKAWRNAIFQDLKNDQLEKALKSNIEKKEQKKNKMINLAAFQQKQSTKEQIKKTRNHHLKYKRLNFVTFWIIERLSSSREYPASLIEKDRNLYHPFWPSNTSDNWLKKLDEELFDLYSSGNISSYFKIPQELMPYFGEAKEDTEWPDACDWLVSNWDYIYNFKEDLIDSIASERRVFRKVQAVTYSEIMLKFPDFKKGDGEPIQLPIKRSNKEKSEEISIRSFKIEETERSGQSNEDENDTDNIKKKGKSIKRYTNEKLQGGNNGAKLIEKRRKQSEKKEDKMINRSKRKMNEVSLLNKTISKRLRERSLSNQNDDVPREGVIVQNDEEYFNSISNDGHNQYNSSLNEIEDYDMNSYQNESEDECDEKLDYGEGEEEHKDEEEDSEEEEVEEEDDTDDSENY